MDHSRPKANSFRKQRKSCRMARSALEHSYRKPSEAQISGSRKWVKVQKLKVYSIEQIISLKDTPRASDLDYLNPEILGRRLVNNSACWRHISEWSAKVRETSDSITRKFKSLLNKLAPSNIQSIRSQVFDHLTSQTSACFGKLLLNKSISEHKFGSLYAEFTKDVIEFRPEFKKDFLTACQILFDEIVFQTEDRKRLFGFIGFVGQLFNFRVIPVKILFGCCDLMVLNRGEIAIEGMCHLLGTCNWVFKSRSLKEKAHGYLKQLGELKDCFTSRVRFKILDLLESNELKLLQVLNTK